MHNNSSLEPAAWTLLRRGYGWDQLRRDLGAGLTVAVVALPLSMALAIASGAAPEKGLHTAIVAGFLISVLGGSRVQIGGPTGAFIPVVFAVIQEHGYDGLLLATLIASVLLVIASFARLGSLMRFMPQPVITGFTAGIAVIIFISQIKDLLGLEIAQLPAEFGPKMMALADALPSVHWPTVSLAVATLIAIILMRRLLPRWPAFLIAVIAAALACALLPFSLDTIQTRFGDVPSSMPSLALPTVDLAQIIRVLPAAFTIAFLAGLESLMSAAVADGMIGEKHRPNAELMAQGVANAASAAIGGLPATGAVARTATNVRAGAVTPVAGVIHALLILLGMSFFAPLLGYIPLAALAAVLLVVAWNMSEHEEFRHLLRAPVGDRWVLLVSFGLTVAVDLTLAIEVGMVMAAFLFMHRMAFAVEMDAIEPQSADDSTFDFPDQRELLPEGIVAFQIQGPLFFGAASRLQDVPRLYPQAPPVFILRMSSVPMIDASGAHALRGFLGHWHRAGTNVIISGLKPSLKLLLTQMRIAESPGDLRFVDDFDHALTLARDLMDRT